MGVKISQEQIMNEIRTIDKNKSPNFLGDRNRVGEIKEREAQDVVYQRPNCVMYVPIQEIKNEKGEVMPFSGFNNIKISAQGWQALDYLISGLDLKRNMNEKEIFLKQKIRKPISEWCELFGLTAHADNINTLKSYLWSLVYPVIVYQGKKVLRDENGDVIFKKDKNGNLTNQRKEGRKTVLGFHIINDVDITDGWISISLNASFLTLLADYAFIMPYNEKLFLINNKYNPYSYNLAYKIQFHSWKNRTKPNKDIISVKALTDVCDAIPDVSKLPKDKYFKEKIVKPFERDMNKLIELGIISNWCYWLNDDEYTGKVNAKNFYELNIKFSI